MNEYIIIEEQGHLDPFLFILDIVVIAVPILAMAYMLYKIHIMSGKVEFVDVEDEEEMEERAV